jgi:dolichol-phosphate mannosyltransferase
MSIIVIPTYNERASIRPLVRELLELEPKLDVLIVDDNSPDGTAVIAKQMQLDYPDRLHVMVRPEKDGLASAYRDGFRKALELGHELIIQMDCDFSHDPVSVPNLIAALSEADLAIGSRYLDQSKIINWPVHRVLLSRFGCAFYRTMIGLPLTDPTAGFKAWRASMLKKVIDSPMSSKGYSFQLETNTIAQQLGATIKEIPITFRDRTLGQSKLSLSIIIEAFNITFKLRGRMTKK